jgi:hypothetical protein
VELPAHWVEFGFDLDLPDDVSAADWLEEALRPWSWPDGDGVTRIASFVPDTYEAFARILHPLRWGTGRGGRWSDLAATRGVTIGPETSFTDATGISATRNQRLWDAYQPSDGSLPTAEMAALGATLAPYTGTPDDCVFCFWVGSGAWGSDNGETYYGHLTDEENEALNAPVRERWQRELAAEAEIPQVRLPAREHYLLTGPLGRTARPFGSGIREQSPSMWWPADRAWFVATEVDGFSSYVGGSQTAIDAVLASPELEAIAVTARTPLDPGPFA